MENMYKKDFEKDFLLFINELKKYVSDNSGNWSIKGFIDINKNVFTISTDTKLISKVFEIHIIPLIYKFADKIGFDLILPKHQNYYPDLTFICKNDKSIKYAVDIKTTYRKNEDFCNGFTLGSHGEYFINRNSKKNIQFPYNEYKSHYCLGIIYSRTDNIDESKIFKIDDLEKINSVIKDIDFFFTEKWKIASDKSGSGNTANIGSITKISDIMCGNGVFSKYGEKIFDDYWMNYKKITIKTSDGKIKKISNLKDFLTYKGEKQ